MSEIKGLYFITDSGLSKQGILKDTEQVLEANCKIVQYREKGKKMCEKVEEAMQLAKLCREKRALFLINNDVDIALAVDADGIHLGQNDMPVSIARRLLGKGKVIGLTVHNAEEALQAEKQGVDYISISPIFHTDTKKDAGKPAGTQLVRGVRERVKLPIVAIGGIKRENVQPVIEAGANSVAIISAILKAGSPFEEAKKIVGLLGELQ